MLNLPANLGKQPRKWVLPTIWVVLVLVFIKTALSRSKYGSSLDFSLSDAYAHLKHSTVKTDPELNEERMAVNVTTSPKVAVIMETRSSTGIVPLVLHFSAVLGPEWPVIIYSSAENFGTFSTSAALLRHQRSGRVIIRPLPDGLYFPSWDSVSLFLTTPWLWEDLAPAEHILIFQMDSIICGNSARKVEDFFEYDLIGAPIEAQYGVGYNGGLSLRRRSTMLRVLKESEFEGSGVIAEDQWYYRQLRELEDMEAAMGIKGGVNLPPMEIARTFAVESIDYTHPLGLHQPTRFIQDHMLSLDEWCPEYKMASTDHISL